MMSQSVFHARYWRDCARLTTQKLCVMGVLMALQIILSRITAINLGNWLRISFGFLPNAIAGYLLGPIGGTLVAWGSDALGTILTGQAINPGLSVAAALGGFFYGLMLHKRPVTIWRTMACLLVVSLVCHFLLNTYFLAMAGFTAVPRLSVSLSARFTAKAQRCPRGLASATVSSSRSSSTRSMSRCCC